MWEALTDWSENDPKWYVLMILMGAFGVWLGNYNNKHDEKYPERASMRFTIRNNGRTIIFAFAFLIGVLGLLRRLYLAIF